MAGTDRLSLTDLVSMTNGTRVNASFDGKVVPAIFWGLTASHVCLRFRTTDMFFPLADLGLAAYPGTNYTNTFNHLMRR